MAVPRVNAVSHDPAAALVVDGASVADHPRDASECYGSGPIDVLAMGPFIVRRRFGASR